MTGRPHQIVAIQAKTETALGMVMMNEAPLKNDSDRNGMPVANMWCTQTPKPRIIVVTVASTTRRVADQRPAAEDRQRRPRPCPWPAAR